MKSGWYTESHDPSWTPDDLTSTRAKSYAMLKDFAAVRSLIEDIGKAKTGEIIRVIAPLSATREELTELELLGGRLF